MPNIILSALFLLLSILTSGNNVQHFDNEPEIIMYDTVVNPGVVQLQVDALNFVGDNGQISAISLNIDIDTLLLEFVSIQNMSMPGSWVANYNIYQNEISISYNAQMGTGFDIDGKLFDIILKYNGSFNADLIFKSVCEITNVNLQTIQNVVYDNGLIEPFPVSNYVKQDTIMARINNTVKMPLIAMGADYDSVTSATFRVGYDDDILNYTGIVESALTGIEVNNTNQVLTISWSDTVNPVNLAVMDTLMYIEYYMVGDTNTVTEFLPGSGIINNKTVVGSNFFNGLVKAEGEVVLLNSPDTAGTTNGAGYYCINDPVVAVAIPNEGYYFDNWTSNGAIVSTDSIYSFVKERGSDTITANYIAMSYEVELVINPLLSGFVSGGGIYAYGDDVTVTAIPAQGYEFVGWFIDSQLVSNVPEYTFVMPSNDVELTAVFQIMTFVVDVSPNNMIFGSTIGGGQFNYGDSATVVATSNTGYCFVAWTENGQMVSYDSAFVFVVYDNHNLIGNFEQCSSCMPPVGLYADNLDETEATLYWVSSGDEDEWDLIWGEHGFDTATSGNLIIGITEQEYFLNNLDPGSYYDFYVRAKCSSSNYSNWSVVCSFSTWYVGVDNNTDTDEFVLYPNPANNILNISNVKNALLSFNYTITDLVGNQVATGVMNSTLKHIDVSNLNPGLYSIIIYNENKASCKKFIKR